jgi:hypothetical protein
VTDAVHRSERELSDSDRARLEAAQRELAAAVKAYELDETRAAQEAVESAEDHLWQLREELLGWVRPPWAPSATLTADWFSAEDAVYDDLPETTSS